MCPKNFVHDCSFLLEIEGHYRDKVNTELAVI